jgi:hypothetical protein
MIPNRGAASAGSAKAASADRTVKSAFEEERALYPLGRQLRNYHRFRKQALSSKSPGTYANATRVPW